MPDWLTHSLVGWITGKTTRQEVSVVVVGSLLPDLVKVDLLVPWYTSGFFEPLHTPVGAVLVAGLVALLFPDIRRVFVLLLLGVCTHFILDFFLVHVQGSLKLLFPFSWEGWQYPLIRPEDYLITVVAVLAALFVYGVFWAVARRTRQKTR
jgi:membrane-bound metal-dependent hydrolase YbcI (DUF457 family)